MASSSPPFHPLILCHLLTALLVVGISATNNASLIPEESVSGLLVQERESNKISPATPHPPVNETNNEIQLIFPQQSLDPVCRQVMLEHLLKFLYRIQQGRQDEDDDDYAPGILESLQSVGAAFGWVNISTTVDPIIEILPSVVNSLHHITGAVNEQLAGTDTPNIPAFLVKQGQAFISSLIAHREAALAARLPKPTSSTAKTLTHFPGVDSITHSTSTTSTSTTTSSPQSVGGSGRDPTQGERESTAQFISELLSFLRANVSTRITTTTTTPKPLIMIPATIAPKPRPAATTSKPKPPRRNPTTTATTTKQTTTPQATTEMPLDPAVKVTPGAGGRPIFWMNMFYPFGIPDFDLTTEIDTDTTTTMTTIKPRRRRRKTTTTPPTTTVVEWEYYDDEHRDSWENKLKKKV